MCLANRSNRPACPCVAGGFDRNPNRLARGKVKYVYQLPSPVTKSAVIADDDETIRSILQYKLSNAGFELRVCSDGEECRQVLSDGSVTPDIVILDVMMPRMKGTQVLRAIRRGELAVDATVPVVLLTSRGQEADVLEGLEAGASEYLTKPFSPSELLVRVNRLIEG